jgi:hypothetical protein
MIERIEDMPAGTVGLRASGKLIRDDYRVHMFACLDVLGDRSGFEPSKPSRMTPGDVMICELDRLDDAKTWVAA